MSPSHTGLFLFAPAWLSISQGAPEAQQTLAPPAPHLHPGSLKWHLQHFRGEIPELNLERPFGSSNQCKKCYFLKTIFFLFQLRLAFNIILVSGVGQWLEIRCLLVFALPTLTTYLFARKPIRLRTASGLQVR